MLTFADARLSRPKGEPKLRVCIVLSFCCLVLSKVWNVLVPIMMKEAVDQVAEGHMPVGPIVLYGAPPLLHRPLFHCLLTRLVLPRPVSLPHRLNEGGP